MARIVGVLHMAHSPFCYMDVAAWEAVRANRPLREDVPFDSYEVCVDKHARVTQSFAALRRRLAELGPDLLVVFGDDQEELFRLDNHPALAVYVGERYAGRTPAHENWFGNREVPSDLPLTEVANHRGLATALLGGLLQRGFDPAFMTEVPAGSRGMAHAVMRPLDSLDAFGLPSVPILINAYYAPQVTARRCVEIGRAVRNIINDYPEDLRVVVVASGGLWHTPFQPNSYLDEDFDRRGLEFLAAGDADGWARCFDDYRVADGDTSQDSVLARRGVTGLPTPGGPQGGTRETVNWIAAAATCEGTPATIIDYIPIYFSPVGAGFASSILE